MIVGLKIEDKNKKKLGFELSLESYSEGLKQYCTGNVAWFKALSVRCYDKAGFVEDMSYRRF